MTLPLEKNDLLTAVCVDDSEFDRKLHDRVLRRSGAFGALYHYPSGEDALEHLRTAPRCPTSFSWT